MLKGPRHLGVCRASSRVVPVAAAGRQGLSDDVPHIACITGLSVVDELHYKAVGLHTGNIL
jgi:hypothetical protein